MHRSQLAMKPMNRATIVIIFIATSLAACSATSGRPARIDLLQKLEDATGVEKDLIQLETAYDASSDAAGRQLLRNRLARKMVALTDHRYHNFIDSIVVQKKAFESTSDIAAITLDTASVLVTPASTKSILAGLSGLTTASKTTVNKVYFYDQTLPILISQMEADRQAVLVDIYTGLQKADEEYPLYLVLGDLVRYYSAGTIDGALQQIQRQAASTANNAEVAMRETLDNDLDQAAVRKQAALRLAKEVESFQALRGAATTWWGGLSEDEQFEHTAIIQLYAGEHGVDASSLDPSDGSSAPNTPAGFGPLLESLDPTKPTHQLLLAEIVKHSNIETP